MYLPLIYFSIINSISLPVNNSNFTLAFLKEACHVNTDADKK